jgi:hypothetical protein
MIQQKTLIRTKPGLNGNQELSRILSAAVINNRFRSQLLNDPLSAVTSGYSGERFSLENEEMQKLRSINAGNLADFAAQLTKL